MPQKFGNVKKPENQLSKVPFTITFYPHPAPVADKGGKSIDTKPSPEVERAVKQFCAKYGVDSKWVKDISELCCATGKPPLEAIEEAVSQYLKQHRIKARHACSDLITLDVLDCLTEMQQSACGLLATVQAVTS